MIEEWKLINGFGNKYYVSNLGRVKNGNTNYIFKARPNKTGYLRVPLSFNGKTIDLFIHKLVAKAFIVNDDPINKTQVNHIDFNKNNNTVDNLEWCTPSYNTKHAFINNRKSNKGINNPRTKLTIEQVNEIIYLARNTKMSNREIGELFGLKRSAVSAIKTGKNWSNN